jgi:hypothetical protein
MVKYVYVPHIVSDKTKVTICKILLNGQENQTIERSAINQPNKLIAQQSPHPCPHRNIECDSDAIEMHPCPYAEAINDDYNDACACCDKCTLDCQDNI